MKMTLKTFKPDFNILPQLQKDLWLELKDVPDSFVLYGGTAIALQLGHRESEVATLNRTHDLKYF